MDEFDLNWEKVKTSMFRTIHSLATRWESPDDYVGDDGLLHCCVCREPKQKHKKIMGQDTVVAFPCACQRKEREREEAEDKRNAEMVEMDKARSISLLSTKYQSASFETYARNQNNEKAYRIAKNYVKHFDEMYKKGQGLLFYGPVGTGKTYTAACIANALFSCGVPVIMTSFNEILKKIADKDQSENQLFTRLNAARLLILDDLGAERSTSYALEKVYDVIDGRVRIGKPMILTTNLTAEEIIAPKEIAYDRIYNRILEVCVRVNIPGSSRRYDSAKKRLSEVRALLTEDCD